MAIVLNFLAMIAYVAGGGLFGSSISVPREQRKTSRALIAMGLMMLGFILDGVAFTLF